MKFGDKVRKALKKYPVFAEMNRKVKLWRIIVKRNPKKYRFVMLGKTIAIEEKVDGVWDQIDTIYSDKDLNYWIKD